MQRSIPAAAWAAILSLLLSGPASAATLQVGPQRALKLPSEAAKDASIGHNVKSRAQENYILYNRIMDERNGSSYLVDLPDGGNGYLIGNLFHQSANTDNPAMMVFAAEHNQNKPEQVLYVVNNTFVNDRAGGIFVKNHSVAPAILINNLFAGQGTVLVGPGEQKQNLAMEEAGFKNRATYDYHLLPGSVRLIKASIRDVHPVALNCGQSINTSIPWVSSHAGGGDLSIWGLMSLGDGESDDNTVSSF